MRRRFMSELLSERLREQREQGEEHAIPRTVLRQVVPFLGRFSSCLGILLLYKCSRVAANAK